MKKNVACFLILVQFEQFHYDQEKYIFLVMALFKRLHCDEDNTCLRIGSPFSCRAWPDV